MSKIKKKIKISKIIICILLYSATGALIKRVFGLIKRIFRS